MYSLEIHIIGAQFKNAFILLKLTSNDLKADKFV